MLTRRAALLAVMTLPVAARAAAGGWDDTLRAARGKTVFFNAWGGDESTNAFIAWAGERMRMDHGVTVRHVRLADTGEAVARIVAERAAGRTEGGSVDMLWVNGPNFMALKQARLLRPNVLDTLPNAAFVDASKPTRADFTVPTDGDEVPWRMAKLVFVHDSARAKNPPRTMASMPAWAAVNPGRLAHPSATNFLGATFLKQALIELAPNAGLGAPPTEPAYAAATKTLFEWYDALRPNLWSKGADFPADGDAATSLLNDGEIDLTVSFNPAEAANGIAHGTLPATARAYALDGGTIGNCSFVAIPYDAANPEAALALANFLLSPEAQAHAADPRHLGSPTVLDLSKLSPADRTPFDTADHLPGTLSEAELGPTLPEPHPAWMTRIATDWQARVLR